MDGKQLLHLITEKYAESFKIYKDLLQERNKLYNLTAVTDDEGILYKHFLDSIYTLEYFEEGSVCLDVGAGAGFPSIPLKIVRSDLKFTLIESTGKKCNFLSDLVKILNLDGTEIKNIRAEDGARTSAMREKFDICCARAVAPLNTLAEYCLPFVKKGGKFVAYKGDCAEELKNAAGAIEKLGGKLEDAVRYEVENCGGRTLVIVRKIKNTPAIYPRGQGRERKNPL